jgi:hypothetical protein
VNVPAKSPSVWRVVVIAGTGAVLASAMTPAFAAPTRVKKTAVEKKHPPVTVSKGGGGNARWVEWAISATLRP